MENVKWDSNFGTASLDQHRLTFKEALLHELIRDAYQTYKRGGSLDLRYSEVESLKSEDSSTSRNPATVVTSVNEVPSVSSSISNRVSTTIQQQNSILSDKSPTVYNYTVSNDFVPLSHYLTPPSVPFRPMNRSELNRCPLILKYPRYAIPPSCNLSVTYFIFFFPDFLRIFPCNRLGRFPDPSPALYEEGIVFYSYSTNGKSNRYMPQVYVNARSILEMDPTAHIALITNCDVPLETAALLSVIIPVHRRDIIPMSHQWYTRMVYNAYLPFQLSFILDTHVFPCDSNAYRDVFALFRNSSVDVSVSNRMNTHSYSGGAVLSRKGPASFRFWKSIAKAMRRKSTYDDQWGLGNVLRRRHPYLKYRRLSSNFFYASHGITKDGVFAGLGRCYRSSIVITGPVRWIHGKQAECAIVNGPNYEHAYKTRAYFKGGQCRTRQEGPTMVFSSAQMKAYAAPARPPSLIWANVPGRSATGLFWK